MFFTWFSLSFHSTTHRARPPAPFASQARTSPSPSAALLTYAQISPSSASQRLAAGGVAMPKDATITLDDGTSIFDHVPASASSSSSSSSELPRYGESVSESLVFSFDPVHTAHPLQDVLSATDRMPVRLR